MFTRIFPPSSTCFTFPLQHWDDIGARFTTVPFSLSHSTAEALSARVTRQTISRFSRRQWIHPPPSLCLLDSSLASHMNMEEVDIGTWGHNGRLLCSAEVGDGDCVAWSRSWVVTACPRLVYNKTTRLFQLAWLPPPPPHTHGPRLRNVSGSVRTPLLGLVDNGV